MGRATTDARQGFDPVHGLLHGVGRLGGKCFPQGGGMAVPGRRLGMGVKLPEGLEATGLVGVNEIPHGALRHADYARHVVARVAKTYPNRACAVAAARGDVDEYTALPRGPSCPLRESESGSYGHPPRSRCETSKSPSSVIEQESLVQSLKNPARSGKENHQKLAARSIELLDWLLFVWKAVANLF